MAADPLAALSSYDFTYLPGHLVAANRVDHLHALLALQYAGPDPGFYRNAWYEARSGRGELVRFRADAMLAWSFAERAAWSQPGEKAPESVALVFRYPLLAASVASQRPAPELVRRLVQAQAPGWTLHRVLDIVAIESSPQRRVQMIETIAPLFDQGAATEAMAIIREDPDTQARAAMTAAVVPRYRQQRLGDAVKAIVELSDPGGRIRALRALRVSETPDDSVIRAALAGVQGIAAEEARGEGLRVLIERFGPRTADCALDAIADDPRDFARGPDLIIVFAHLSAAGRRRAIESAMRLRVPDRQSATLAAFVPAMSSADRDTVVGAVGVRRGFPPRAVLLEALIPHLRRKQRDQLTENLAGYGDVNQSTAFRTAWTTWSAFRQALKQYRARKGGQGRPKRLAVLLRAAQTVEGPGLRRRALFAAAQAVPPDIGDETWRTAYKRACKGLTRTQKKEMAAVRQPPKPAEPPVPSKDTTEATVGGETPADVAADLRAVRTIGDVDWQSRALAALAGQADGDRRRELIAHLTDTSFDVDAEIRDSERRRLLIRAGPVGSMASLPYGIVDRFMSARMPHADERWRWALDHVAAHHPLPADRETLEQLRERHAEDPDEKAKRLGGGWWRGFDDGERTALLWRLLADPDAARLAYAAEVFNRLEHSDARKSIMLRAASALPATTFVRFLPAIGYTWPLQPLTAEEVRSLADPKATGPLVGEPNYEPGGLGGLPKNSSHWLAQFVGAAPRIPDTEYATALNATLSLGPQLGVGAIRALLSFMPEALYPKATMMLIAQGRLLSEDEPLDRRHTLADLFLYTALSRANAGTVLREALRAAADIDRQEVLTVISAAAPLIGHLHGPETITCLAAEINRVATWIG